MVVPFGEPGMVGIVGPPAELTKYRPALVLIAVGYTVVIVVGLAGGWCTNSLSYIFVIAVSLLMACKPNDCLGQCVGPLTLLSSILLLFDVVPILLMFLPKALGTSASTAFLSTFFSTSCPSEVLATISGGSEEDPIKMWTTNGTAIYLLGYQVNAHGRRVMTLFLLPVDPCSWQSVLRNASLLGGVLMDCLALFVSSQMRKSVQLGGLLSGDIANPIRGSVSMEDTGRPGRFQPFQGQPQALDA